MIRHEVLSHEMAIRAVKDRELPSEVTRAADSVILILTQSWCPQWRSLQSSLRGLGEGPEDLDVALIVYEYDRSPIFGEFMSFKEQSFRNWEVPYVRLYRKGTLIADGNNLPASRMIEALRNA